jgi:asparagine synthase (glutamine-hydrolysing)
MCGISGIYANSINNQHTTIVTAITESQFNRGPDSQAINLLQSKQSQVLFGHNRLSIIDLSDHANQPMYDVTGRYGIVYNGEVYNYIELRAELMKLGLKFNTNSDTEVVLNAFAIWGIESLKRFHGPFAFALFDKKSGDLWLCRDRFGVKPLFYFNNNKTLYFASTSSVLAKALNLKPNLDYVAKGLKYLVYEDGSEISAYQSLLSVPAGSYLHCRFSQEHLITVVKEYYNLSNNVQDLICNLSGNRTEDLFEQIINKLNNAVNIRLRTDVPLGISLSGGLDSSSVAALVSKQHANTIGFSFGHPDNKLSEGPLVKSCAKFLNIPIEYVSPTANEMIDALYKTIEIQDAPFSSLSVVAQYLLYQKVHSSGVKVLLGGQGGDEAFMGYKKYLIFSLQKNLKEKRFFSLCKNILYLFPSMLSDMTSLKTYWRHRHRYLSGKPSLQNKTLLLPESAQLSLGNTANFLWKRQLADITQFSLPTLLRYEDRNSMGNSVESRLPYMDHQLVELGLALPQNMKLHAGYGKWVIRKIMQNKIPNNIRLARYKRGFDIPLIPLLKAGLGQSLRSTLNSNKKMLGEFLQKHVDINTIFSDQRLANQPSAMAEAITLLWLNKVII